MAETADSGTDQAKTRAGALPVRESLRAKAHESLNRLRGAVVVIKYGGAVMGDAELADRWARDVVLIEQCGLRPVIVHGGGSALTRTLGRMGIESSFVDGHRVTTGESAEVAEMVLSGRINKEVVSRLIRAGSRAIGLSGTDGGILKIRPHRPAGRDIGFVGEVEAVAAAPLRLLLENGYTPVLSSTAADRDGQPFNINADLVAGAVAGALGAARLVFLSDVPGLLVDGQRVPVLGAAKARALLAGSDVTGGMRPKIEAALAALEAGVPEVHLVDGRDRDALLAELFFEGGNGTRLVPDSGISQDARFGPKAAQKDGRALRVDPSDPLETNTREVTFVAQGAPSAPDSWLAQDAWSAPVTASGREAASARDAASTEEAPSTEDVPSTEDAPPAEYIPRVGPGFRQPGQALGAWELSRAKPSTETSELLLDPPPWAGTLAGRGEGSVMGTYARYPLELVSGRGCRVFDSAGRSYLDFVAGIAVNVLGHGHPAVVAALRSATEGPLHFSNLYWSEPMVRLAERLTRAAGMDRAFFCNSGTEAIETALKIARKARPGRGRIVVFERSFHGRTLGALSATMQGNYQEPFRPLLAGFVPVPFGDFEAAAQAIDGETAAVLVEPIQGEGGVRPAPPGWLEHLRKESDRAGALLILDEVQTGLGRTGSFFAYEDAGILPDAVACAKALAGGLPMGALLARGEAACVLGAGDHGCTFGGGPFIATVANAVLDTILAPGFLDGVKGVGERLEASLHALGAKYPDIVASSRGSGLMWGMVFRGPLAPQLVGELHAIGLLTVPAGKDVLRLLPPLTIDPAEIEEGAALLEEGLRRLSARLGPGRAEAQAW